MTLEAALRLARSPGYAFPSATAALALSTVLVRRVRAGKARIEEYADVLSAAADYLSRASEPAAGLVAAEIRALLP